MKMHHIVQLIYFPNRKNSIVAIVMVKVGLPPADEDVRANRKARNVLHVIR